MPSATPDPHAIAWNSQELANPHQSAEKAGKVRRMFAAIAPRYDLNNRLHSLWQDQAWRKAAVKASLVRPGEHVLDVACGTGDLSQAFASGVAERVVGVDFTAEMLDIARRKLRDQPPGLASKLSYAEGDAQALNFADRSFDVVSIAFGIRNVVSPITALREFHRVLRPGGRLVVLEFDRPRCAPVRWFNDVYCGWIMPRTATLISGDRSGAYRYLPKSVGTFLSREQLCDAMRQAGFSDVGVRSLSMGICACYTAVKVA